MASPYRRETALDRALAFAALAAAFVVNYALGRLSERLGAHAHTSPDLLHSVLPLVDMRFFFVWGFAAFLALAFGAGFAREKDRAAHIAWSYALLVILRSVFIVLTPMRLPAGALPIQGYPIFDALGKFMTFDTDLFFSGHTAFPFLGFLAYRDRRVRLACLGISLLLAATVILSRLHYSIDVFGAYFITYGLYRWQSRHLPLPSSLWGGSSGDASLLDSPTGMSHTMLEAVGD